MFGLFKPKKPREPQKPKKKNGRPTREEAAERRVIQLKDAETRLKLAKMQRELEKLEGGADDEAAISHKTVMATVKYLKGLGLEVRPAGGGKAIDDDGVGAMLKGIAVDIGKGVAESFIAKQQAQAEPQQAPPPRPQLAVVPVQPQVQQAPPPPEPEEAGMSIKSMILVGQFDTMSPEQFVRWLIQQDPKSAAALMQKFAAMSDDELPRLLAEMPEKTPELAGFAAHLRKHPAKFMACVRVGRAIIASANANRAESEPPEGEDVGL